MIKRDGIKAYVLIGCTFLVSILLFRSLEYFHAFFYRIYRPEYYLTFHTLLELASIVVSFCIFTLCFYTFQRTHYLRTITIACTFLAIGLLGSFHTLSYKGMPAFFNNNDPNKATTFWMAERMVISLGLLIISGMSSRRKIKWSRLLFLAVTLFLCFYMMYIISFDKKVIPPMFIEGQGLTRLKINLEYVVIVVFTLTAANYLKRFIKERRKVFAWMISGLILSIFSEMAFTLYRNVYDTYNLVGHLYKAIAYYIFFRAFFITNIQQPYVELEEAREEIQHYADHLEELVSQRTREISDVNEKLLKDIEYARNIQRALLPSRFPETDKLRFCSRYIPCERIGGDFYNVVKLDEDHIGIYIGDVSGHGVSAAMITVFLDQSIKMKRVYDDDSYKILPPREVLLNLYHTYNKTEFPDEMYLVMLYGIYHLPTGEFVYSSAGMNAPPIHCSADGNVEFIETKGFPICKFGKYYKPMYENHSIRLAPGEKIIFFTDGLMETMDENAALLKTGHLMNTIKNVLPCSEKVLCDKIMSEYTASLDGTEMIDDVTLLIMGT